MGADTLLMGDVLVAIPTFNEARRITAVLDQLRCDLPQDRATRFLVLDGGSTDGTQGLVMALALADARIELVTNPARIQAAAINMAARLAGPQERFLVRADAPTDYPPGFVAGLLREFSRKRVYSVVVPMDSTGQSCFARAVSWVSDSKVGSGGSAHRGGGTSGFIDHGHHAAWTMDCFRETGGYDESFSHNEDAELDCRITRLGMGVWFAANIRLTYHVRASVAALFRQYRNYGRGRSRTIRRHPGSAKLRQLALPTAVCTLLLAILAGLLRMPAALLLPAA
jgi:succinoglycan biosynthesis protein ExoA